MGIFKSTFSLKKNILMGFSVIFIIFLFVSGGLFSHFLRQTVKSHVQDQLKTMASMIAESLDGDKLMALNTGDEGSPLYNELAEKQASFYKHNSLIDCIFTMKKMPDGKIAFIVDALYLTDPKEAAKINEIYDDASPMTLEGFSGPSADDDFYTDKWGTYLSGYAPIKNNSGQIVAIVGIDFKAADIIKRMNSIVATILAIITAVLIVSGFLLILAAAASITKPVKSAISSLETISGTISGASEEINASSQSLAQAASEQAASVQQTASSLEEITSMINNSAANTKRASDMFKDAIQKTEDGARSVMELSNSMSEIRRSSSDTAKIIKTIDEIAFQTNLLALNAAVEAARAGDAGRGFAVVAEEVRNLSKRSAEAAKNTAELINTSLKNVDSGALKSETVKKNLLEIQETISRVSTIISEVETAGREQAKGISQISAAAAEIDNSTQAISASSEESAATAHEFTSQIKMMAEVVDSLKKIAG